MEAATAEDVPGSECTETSTNDGIVELLPSTTQQEIMVIEEEEEDDHDAMELRNNSTTMTSLAPVPLFRWSPTALAFSNTTPWLARVLFPTLCIMTHILFYYGQTASMWKLRMVADIDVWANATDFTTKQTFNLIGLPYDNHLSYHEDRDVQTFTYYYAIHHLWLAKGIPGKVLPRLAAVLLIIFSGFWPHCKLVWLQATWFFRKQATGRTTTLQWLSTLGKWSLADVLVVCVMVGVLNLDWLVDPAAIKAGVIADLPQILQIVESQYDETGLCNKLLKVHCQSAKKAATRAKCKACTSVVTEAYTRPDWAQSTGKSLLNGVNTSGGGLATLRVIGMSGIYVFCAAVIFSILLSLMVDIFDHRAKQELQRTRGTRSLEEDVHSPMNEPQQQPRRSLGRSSSINDEQHMQEPLLNRPRRQTTPLELDFGQEDVSWSRRRPSMALFSCQFFAIVIGALVLVMMAVDSDTMQRRVFGAGPQLLQDILGIDWQRNYSLRTLMYTTGAHGGWDYMLMGTFGLFCVLGPVIRAVLLVLVALLDRCRLPVEAVANLVNFIGAFCSWEVFVIAIVMVQMLMPSITNTIIQNKVCANLSDDGSCLQVEFNIMPMTFWTILVGGFLLIATSCVAVARGTDRSASNQRSSVAPPRAPMLASVMTPNHNYERLQGVETPNHDAMQEGVHELVFETNQV